MMTEVVAALIWDEDRFLACQRPAHKARGLLWEFVGGKVEPGESREDALIRECREELDITVRVGDIFTQVIHEYPDILIRLTLFHCAVAQGTPKLLEHNDLKWITPDEIPNYDFCPADTDILKQIRKEYTKQMLT
jgi:8-oxo-dGTP diphosphatase